MNASRSNSKQRLTRHFRHVVLAALLLFQIGYASHLDEHTIGEKGDSCEFCIQLEKNSNAVAADPAASPPTTLKHTLPTADIDRIGCQYVASFRARAPPSV